GGPISLIRRGRCDAVWSICPGTVWNRRNAVGSGCPSAIGGGGGAGGRLLRLLAGVRLPVFFLLPANHLAREGEVSQRPARFPVMEQYRATEGGGFRKADVARNDRAE